MTTTTNNPWFEQHVSAESDYQGDAGVARQLVQMEYNLGPEPIECPHCPATTHWKATIGCMKCPSCGGLARSNGTPIGGAQHGH